MADVDLERISREERALVNELMHYDREMHARAGRESTARLIFIPRFAGGRENVVRRNDVHRPRPRRHEVQ